MTTSKILFATDAISRKNGGSASFIELMLNSSPYVKHNIFTILGRLDFIYKADEYKKLSRNVRSIPLKYLNQNYRKLTLKLKIFNAIVQVIERESEPFKNVDIVIDNIGLDVSKISQEYKHIKIFRMHNGSVDAFKNYFGLATQREQKYKERFYIDMMNQYDGLIFQSAEQLEEARRYLKKNMQFFYVAPSCSEVPAEQLECTKHEIVSNKIRLAQIGSIQQRKNQICSIELLKAMVERGLNAELTIVGSTLEQDYFEKLMYQVNRMNLKDRVIFTGHQSSYLKYIANADMVLVPSIAEGISRTMREAFYYGIPVAASRTIGTNELIDRDILIDIKKLIGGKVSITQELLNRYSKRVNEEYSKTYSRAANIKRLNSLYNELCAQVDS